MLMTPHISDLVSPFASTDEEDAKETKKALQTIGRYDPPEWGISGIADNAMFEGLKSLQKDAGLRPDREMKPGGPTQAVLNAEVDRKKHGTEAPRLKIGADVGERASNRPDDVKKVRSGLAHLNYLPKPEATAPKAEFDGLAAGALGGFQQDFNLKHDRFAGVRGPSMTALGRATGPQRRAESLARTAEASASAGNASREQVTAPAKQTQSPTTQKPAPHKRLPIFDQFKPRDAFEEDRYAQLEKLGDLLHQDQPINEPDEMLGVTVLEAFGPDRLPGMRPLTAGKLFRLAHFADRDDNIRDVWEAVADPDFPVRRGRIQLANGDLIEMDQAEANGDDRQFAWIRQRKQPWEPGFGKDIPLEGGGRRGGGGGVGRGWPFWPSAPEEEVPTTPILKNEEHDGNEDSTNTTDQPVGRDDAPPESGKDNVDIADRLKDMPAETETAANSAGQLIENAEAIKDDKSRDRFVDEVGDGVAELETDKNADKTTVSINTNKPKEAADAFIEDMAKINETEIQETESGNRIVVGKDGTRYNACPERISNKGRGLEIIVELPRPGRSPKDGKIKLTYGKPNGGEN